MTSKQKRTPAPWTAVRSIPSDGFDCYWLNGPHGEDLGYLKRNEANALLIAAAPDLYDALKMVQRACSDFREIPMAEQTRTLRAMNDAIAKAEGRTIDRSFQRAAEEQST